MSKSNILETDTILPFFFVTKLNISICIILSYKKDQEHSEFQTLAMYEGRIQTQ